VRIAGAHRLRLTSASLALVSVALTAAACVASDQAAEPSVQPSTTASPGTPATTATLTPTADPPRTLSEAEVAELLRRAVCWHDDPARAADCVPPTEATARAIEVLGRSGDPRFAAPLIDMLWIEVGWGRWVEDALEAITGERLANARAWSAWIAEQQQPLPAGYTGWKGRLLSLVDPRFTELLTGDRAYEPRVEELLWAGVRVGGLPPLDGPETVHRVEERYLDGEDVIFGVQLSGEPRAYPERIVAWHGALHDEIDGSAVLLLHCVPCGSAAAFEGELAGRELRLVASGLVYRSRTLFADEETGSLWDPVSGRAVAGPAFEAGERLVPLPLRRASWAQWSTLHPTTRVLALDTGFVRDYDADVALEADTASPGPLYPAAPLDERLPAKERVLGIELDGGSASTARAYRLDELEAVGITFATLDGEELVLLSRGPGSGVAAYRATPNPIEELVLTDVSGLLAVDSEGESWFVSEQGLVSTLDSTRRAAVPTRTAYWFAWAGAWTATGLDEG
jgi:hypothetical protein